MSTADELAKYAARFILAMRDEYGELDAVTGDLLLAPGFQELWELVISEYGTHMRANQIAVGDCLMLARGDEPDGGAEPRRVVQITDVDEWGEKSPQIKFRLEGGGQFCANREDLLDARPLKIIIKGVPEE